MDEMVDKRVNEVVDEMVNNRLCEVADEEMDETANKEIDGMMDKMADEMASEIMTDKVVDIRVNEKENTSTNIFDRSLSGDEIRPIKRHKPSTLATNTNINIQNRNNNQKPVHEIYRDVTMKSLERYQKTLKSQLDKRNKKFANNYTIGDLVQIKIPEIDRTHSDRKILPCKILEVLENDTYRIGSKSGIIRVTYNVNELLPLGPDIFPELDDIPSTFISIREASIMQSSSQMGNVKCNCKSACDKNHCKCKKVNVSCGSSCHPKNQKCKNTM